MSDDFWSLHNTHARCTTNSRGTMGRKNQHDNIPHEIAVYSRQGGSWALLSSLAIFSRSHEVSRMPHVVVVETLNSSSWVRKKDAHKNTYESDVSWSKFDHFKTLSYAGEEREENTNIRWWNDGKVFNYSKRILRDDVNLRSFVMHEFIASCLIQMGNSL